MSTYRSERWLSSVRAIELCVLCGRHGVQAAHANCGKGMALKVSDCCTAALCPTCHADIDQYRGMSRDESRARMDRAIVLTVERMVLDGVLRIR